MNKLTLTCAFLATTTLAMDVDGHKGSNIVINISGYKDEESQEAGMDLTPTYDDFDDVDYVDPDGFSGDITYPEIEVPESSVPLLMSSGESNCWLRSYGRGVGKPISSCASDKDKSGALCYPKCRDGYKGVGPVCW